MSAGPPVQFEMALAAFGGAATPPGLRQRQLEGPAGPAADGQPESGCGVRSFTFAPPLRSWLGATPVFADIDPPHNIDPAIWSGQSRRRSLRVSVA
jgi:hypothetical protein